MATIYRCDRCHSEQRTKLSALQTENSAGYCFELCKQCLEAFALWVRAGLNSK